MVVAPFLARIGQITATTQRITRDDLHRRLDLPGPADEIKELSDTIDSMLDRLEMSFAQQERFIANASHELRTPLTTLTGYTQLYAAGGLADRAAVDDAMARMRSEAGRMQGLVDGLLLLARLDTEPAPRRERVDLGTLVPGLVADLAVVAADREVRLVDDGTAPYAVPGDPDQLAQVVSVLTSNAVRHTPAGTPVEVRLAHRDGAVRLEVADRGPGIPPEELPRVFDRFHRVADGRSRSTGGNGLGLAIASAVVSAHSGRIGVESLVGAGTTFWVVLPSA